MPLDETHDPALRSWVPSAAHSEFPIQNLPLGVFIEHGKSERRIGAAIGDQILDLRACAEAVLFTGSLADVGQACREPALNALMAMGPDARRELRRRLSALLREGPRGGARSAVEPLLVPRSRAAMVVPADIGDYTDFYASIHHATNVGSMFRPDEPLLPNYRHLPIGYHGRASSIVPSGTAIARPCGQSRPDGSSGPVFGASRRLDYELEVGAFVGSGNALGAPVPIAEAEDHLFGVCLVNDWSARDIQQWEYQPLGPFLAKSFATTISPWIVTMDALEPFRSAGPARTDEDPPLLPYLDHGASLERPAIDLRLEVRLSSDRMRREGHEPVVVSRSSTRHLYWTFAQMVAHHTSNGCNLRPGDLLASGTVSGPTRESRGCLLELTWRGTQPLRLPSGEERRFLEDGDEVVFRGWCERDGFVRIGLGECTGRIVPARTV
ncbi:MAG TPA: fumarylacetoacetase [Vicinamibacterales bacterium]|nr:fumarylacetoacetase [Vicinamibacterales bacterium]